MYRPGNKESLHRPVIIHLKNRKKVYLPDIPELSCSRYALSQDAFIV